MQTGDASGMCTMNQSLGTLVNSERISAARAAEYSHSPGEFLAEMRRA